jgi:hypothetical protein
MITFEDAQQLIEMMELHFVTKAEFKSLDQKFDKLLTRTDKFMKEILDNRQEMTILNYNDNTIKEWMKPVSHKTDVKYPF